MHSQQYATADNPKEGLALLDEVAKVSLEHSIEAPKAKCSHPLADGVHVQPLTLFMLRAVQVCPLACIALSHAHLQNQIALPPCKLHLWAHDS